MHISIAYYVFTGECKLIFQLCGPLVILRSLWSPCFGDEAITEKVESRFVLLKKKQDGGHWVGSQIGRSSG